MNYKLSGEELLLHIKEYFDEIYIFYSDVMVEIGNELTYGTAFIKWDEPKNNSHKIFKDEKLSTMLWKGYGDEKFRVYFIKENDGYKKYLFIANDTSITLDSLTQIMRFYFRTNRRHLEKVFNQKEVQNKFIAQYIKLFPLSIGKLSDGILSIVMSANNKSSITIEDGESYKQVDLGFEECLGLAAFFTNLSNLLLC